MNIRLIPEVLKYLDCFGTTFNFYIDTHRKLYTPLGGILTILSIIFSIIIFIYINIDEFLHNLPNSTTSTEKQNYRQIKFKEEKIWIPWRIRDFGGKTINHTDLLFPIIYYYKGVRNNELKRMVTSYELINYKLCNETSMANNTDLYMIDIELDQLYCIDMEELIIGGSWDSDFLFLISLDIYACKNGIDYNESNINCTTYEKIIEKFGDNNCLEFELYYPVVNYQPKNKTTPIIIDYTNNFYHLSRFSNKIDRLYLQQHILRDDIGWASKKEKIYSRWGCESLNGDSYATANKRDLMNEGSTSRFYSFNIYLKSHVTYYNRSYKKLYLIIADGLPIINIVFIFFRIIAKVFKISSGNKKLTELLFENLKERKSLFVINRNNIKSDKKLTLLKKKTFIGDHNLSINKNINNNDISSANLNYRDLAKKLIFHNNNNNSNADCSNCIKSKNNNNSNNNYNNKSKYCKVENNLGLNKNDNEKEGNRSFNSHLIFEEDKNINNCNDNNNNINQNIDIFSKKNNDMSNLNFINVNINNKSTNNANSSNLKSRTHYIHKELFPYKYYLCSIFIKNFNISKGNFFFTKKFAVVYNFICRLFDISSYLILQREFQTMKNTVIEEKERNIIEKGKKINVSSTSFNINMRECLDSKKLTIFGKTK